VALNRDVDHLKGRLGRDGSGMTLREFLDDEPITEPEVPFPVRGTPGGWQDVWDHDDGVQMRRELEEAERRLRVAVSLGTPERIRRPTQVIVQPRPL
jgi:hypothetical protein